MSITIQSFVQKAKYIHDNYKVKYVWGMSGQKNGSIYECDCRGYAILWILRQLGKTVNCPGTNYSIRNQMKSVHKISNAKDLSVGQVVYKVRQKYDAKYNMPCKYKKGYPDYNESIGQIDCYHIGVVVQTNPLKIYHCSSGGILTDTKLGNWSYAGYLSYIDTSATTKTQTPLQQNTGKVIGGRLNMRQKPSTISNRIIQIPNNSIVTIINKQTQVSGWYYVSFGNHKGYVMSQYIQT